MPLLCPPSKLLDAVNVAPPVKVISLILAHVMVGLPLATLIVAVFPGLADTMPNELFTVPAQLNALVMLYVCPLVNVT